MDSKTLALYLGCQCKVKTTKDSPEYNSIIEELNVRTLFLWVERGHFIQPLLRPLSSMTEEEKPEWNQRKQRKGYMAQIHADNTLWLLSKGFDLFGLIQSGHALDSTSQPEGNTVNDKQQ